MSSFFIFISRKKISGAFWAPDILEKKGCYWLLIFIQISIYKLIMFCRMCSAYLLKLSLDVLNSGVSSKNSCWSL